MKFICRNENEMDVVVVEVLKTISATNQKGAFVVGLHGDLGSGKTTFTKHFAKMVGVEDTVTSPTFVIQKNFDIKSAEPKNFKKLYHFDLYRIESETELSPLLWGEVMNDKNNIVLIEWPEKVKNSLPANMLKINFTFIDENTREVEIIEK